MCTSIDKHPELHVSRYAAMNHYQVIADDNLLVGGDFIKGDGTGSFSIYGDKFPVGLHRPRCVSNLRS